MGQAARKGISPHDWHVGNIGFMDINDNDPEEMKLLDWEKNNEAKASESYAERMEQCMNRFALYLPGPQTYDPKWTEKLDAEAAAVRSNVAV